MSNLKADLDPNCADRHQPERHESHTAAIAPGFNVRRAFPVRGRRRVGPWCFFDHMGPAELGVEGMVVPPHPHIGLQTVTWLFEGAVLHKDSIGTAQTIRPGELNVMTSGRGTAHSEESFSPQIHGVQLWVALPPAQSEIAPHFEHFAALPTTSVQGCDLTIFAGKLAGASSPARFYSPIVGAELALLAGAKSALAIDATFEHAIVPVEGTIEANGQSLTVGEWLFLPCGASLELSATSDARALLVGGPPHEALIVWWNFVARSVEQIEAARADWAAGERFGVVDGWGETRLNAPPSTPNLLAR